MMSNQEAVDSLRHMKDPDDDVAWNWHLTQLPLQKFSIVY